MGMFWGLVGSVVVGMVAGTGYVLLESSSLTPGAGQSRSSEPRSNWTAHAGPTTRQLGTMERTPRIDFAWSELAGDTRHKGKSAALIQFKSTAGKTEICGLLLEEKGPSADRVMRWLKTATLSVADIKLPAAFVATPLVLDENKLGFTDFAAERVQCLVAEMPWKERYPHSRVTISGPDAIVK